MQLPREGRVGEEVEVREGPEQLDLEAGPRLMLHFFVGNEEINTPRNKNIRTANGGTGVLRIAYFFGQPFEVELGGIPLKGGDKFTITS